MQDAPLKTIQVRYIRGEGDDKTSSNLVEFIDELRATLETIPSAYRSSTTIEFHSGSDYDGCPSTAIEISYERPETDEEAALRVELERHEVMKDARWVAERIKLLKNAAVRAGVDLSDLKMVKAATETFA